MHFTSITQPCHWTHPPCPPTPPSHTLARAHNHNVMIDSPQRLSALTTAGGPSRRRTSNPSPLRPTEARPAPAPSSPRAVGDLHRDRNQHKSAPTVDSRGRSVPVDNIQTRGVPNQRLWIAGARTPTPGVAGNGFFLKYSLPTGAVTGIVWCDGDLVAITTHATGLLVTRGSRRVRRTAQQASPPVPHRCHGTRCTCRS